MIAAMASKPNHHPLVERKEREVTRCYGQQTEPSPARGEGVGIHCWHDKQSDSSTVRERWRQIDSLLSQVPAGEIDTETDSLPRNLLPPGELDTETDSLPRSCSLPGEIDIETDSLPRSCSLPHAG